MHPQHPVEAMVELRDDMETSLKSDPITLDRFEQKHDEMSQTIDKRIWPIAAATVLIGTVLWRPLPYFQEPLVDIFRHLGAAAGSAVGVIIPAMPLLASDLGIGPAEYGIVIGGLALTKLIGNIPSSNAADKHGRKSLLVNGLVVMAVANAVIGLAHSMEVLLLGRLLTGVGVAMFVTSSALYSTDVSNVLNRARTMAPVGIAFSVGATLGPAIGGVLTSAIGISNTFYLVGATFGMLAGVLKFSLVETLKVKIEREYSSYMSATMSEMREWKALMQNEDIRSTVLFNMAYWVAFSGCQMTMLPLMLMDGEFGLGPAGIGVS